MERDKENTAHYISQSFRPDWVLGFYGGAYGASSKGVPKVEKKKLNVKFKKCEFKVMEMDFLGHIIAQ